MIRGLCTFLAALALIGMTHSGGIATEVPPLRQMPVNGVELAYVVEGEGETVVFVHGAGGDWRTWDEVRPKIVAGKYRYAALSLRYHYPNSWADDGKLYTVNQHIDDIATFIRGLNVGKVYLVGNSFSGRLVGNVVLRHPDLIRGAVLGEPSLAATSSPEGKTAVAAFQQDMGKASVAAKAGNAREAAILMFDGVNTPNTFDKMPTERQQRWLQNEKTVPLLYIHGAAPPVTCAQLGEIKIPIMVVAGAKTRDSYKATNEALVACLPSGTQSIQIPDAHHMWPTENPNVAADAILAFLNRLR